MLTTRLRKQIEWHFYNYKADLALYQIILDKRSKSVSISPYDDLAAANG